MVLFQTIVLLAASNVFMTLAWYWHLKGMNDKPWLLAALVSWGIALAEYLIQVPANRLGHTQYSVATLKILQEVIALSVFVPVAIWMLREPVRWDYLWAAACMVGAVFFVFRGQSPAPTTAQPSQNASTSAAPPDDVDHSFRCDYNSPRFTRDQKSEAGSQRSEVQGWTSDP